MDISIVIATHNRSASLGRALRSLCALRRPENCRLEVIVVASACSDDTVERASHFTNDLSLRILEEPLPGLSRARNRALDEINADLAIFLDDDVTVDPDLLQAYRAAIIGYPEHGFFGGAIAVRFEGAPSGLVRDIARILPSTWSHLWLGGQARPFDPAAFEAPYGANMAIRMDRLGGRRFDMRFGRQGDGKLQGGEETCLFEGLRNDGMAGIWVPDARVEHWIDPARQSLGYASRYWREAGVLQMRIGHYRPEMARLKWKQRIVLLWRVCLYRLRHRPDMWLPAFRELRLEKGRCDAASGNGWG